MANYSTPRKPVVLVTGINGFIAAHVAAAFLHAGYAVRGSFWSQNPVPNELLEALQRKFGIDIQNSGLLDLFEVEDICRPGSFDEAVKDVVAICHLASPISLQFTDPAPVMHAAVQGTLSLLNSALHNAGPHLKAFVLAGSSSSMGLHSLDKTDKIYTEADWNDAVLDVVNDLGKEAPGRLIYAASKTAAEKAFWKFRQETEEKRKFSMTVINPATVLGPPLYMPPKPDLLSPSIRLLYDTVVDGKGISTVRGGGTVMSAVDVRDVARLMLWAVQHPGEADGQRFLACAWNAAPELVTNILRNNFPNLRLACTDFDFCAPQIQDVEADYSSEKALKATNQGWIGLEKSIVDAADMFLGTAVTAQNDRTCV
ncbi:hypothetical protein N0V93_008893 [Gnomoniopsis smithogilvyi]|uniref:NAD-dependent epimerase/dehydratase domain-containing protein n=1 Tax=Gnomoniopsis smithogilvyi TaxID=1191159 RepID=A0A9W8YM29_9PEZI|nr:hypothetical protein N0V93_008893 [Gnomoniopsis smithogilvyi]